MISWSLGCVAGDGTGGFGLRLGLRGCVLEGLGGGGGFGGIWGVRGTKGKSSFR